MTKKLLLTIISIAATFLLSIISCAQRENGIGIRNNPFDAGGENWTENAAPEISIKSDSLWADFDYSCTTGTIKVFIEEDDINFPYDTVYGAVFIGGKEIKLPASCKKITTSIHLQGIKPNSSPRCSFTASDKKHANNSKTITIHAPSAAPVKPPSAKIINNTQGAIITWTRIPQAKSYTVYYSDSLKGPFKGKIYVKQSSNSLISTGNLTTTYVPRYYIATSNDNFGTSWSKDTLVGRKFSYDITTPSFNSISKGTYSTHISLSIYISYYTNIDHIEILRSEKDTNSFHLIGNVKLSGSSSVYYNDSVRTTVNWYYKIIAVDKLGRSSFPSTSDFGYLRRLYQPVVNQNQYYDHIQFFWNSISGAVRYRIYRSNLSCSDSVKLLKETTLTTFSDTPSTGNYYYYSFCAVDSNRFEGTRSSCIESKILVLP